MFYNILYVCVLLCLFIYVSYMLDIGERAIELMFSVDCHADEHKDYLSTYLVNVCLSVCVPESASVLQNGPNNESLVSPFHYRCWYSAEISLGKARVLLAFLTVWLMYLAVYATSNTCPSLHT